jgi:hypothetical protein
VKFRFDESTIQNLLQIQWWDWSDKLIKKHATLLSKGKIDEFLKLADEISTKPSVT